MAFGPLEELLRPYLGKGVVFDTNLLVLLLVARRGLQWIGRARRTESYTPAEGRLLLHIAGRFRVRYTTPSILAECTNLLEPFWKALSVSERERFLRELRAEVSSLDEQYTPARALADDTNLLPYGFTDVACARIAREGALVLTADVALYGLIASRNLPVINFNHIRNLAE